MWVARTNSALGVSPWESLLNLMNDMYFWTAQAQASPGSPQEYNLSETQDLL